MRAMILAAGRGQRMMPLTEQTPKCLLTVNGQSLISYHLNALAKIGIQDIVINVAYRAEHIIAELGDGERFGVNIHYSLEAEALETGGGIVKALPLLSDQPFLLVNSDVWTDYPFAELLQQPQGLAHLVLVDKAAHRPQGDYCLAENKVQHTDSAAPSLTYSGIAALKPELFKRCTIKKFRLPDVLAEYIEQGLVTGEHYRGQWFDVGTPERLQTLNE